MVFGTVLSMSDIFLFWFPALGKREIQQPPLNFLGINCQICRGRKLTSSAYWLQLQAWRASPFWDTVADVGQDNDHSREGHSEEPIVQYPWDGLLLMCVCTGVNWLSSNCRVPHGYYYWQRWKRCDPFRFLEVCVFVVTVCMCVGLEKCLLAWKQWCVQWCMPHSSSAQDIISQSPGLMERDEWWGLYLPAARGDWGGGADDACVCVC